MRKLIYIALLPLVWLVSCGPSNEQLGENWEKNKAKASELAKKYPNLKSLLDEEVAEGTSVFDKALAEKDEDKKGDLLKSANGKLERGLMGHVGGLEHKSEELSKSISELYATAKGLSVAESSTKYKDALSAEYGSLDAAKKAVLGAKSNAEKAHKSVTNLLAKVKELEALKRDAGAIESKIDATLTDEEYTVRVLKQVTDLKEVANDAKTAYVSTFETYAAANTVVTYHIAAIKEKLSPLQSLLKSKTKADSTSTSVGSNTNNTSTNNDVATCKCKYCKTENVCTEDKCKKCNAPL